MPRISTQGPLPAVGFVLDGDGVTTNKQAWACTFESSMVQVPSETERWALAQVSICARLRSHRYPLSSTRQVGECACSAMLLARAKSEFRTCSYHAIAVMVVEALIS
mmetsp:Transcript_89234/g.247814  ORF Transcript_89234/g.247814 Transcript_89234/m.247814 type:complete len:107 (+) Transcript_89234:84-404(+)